ncbi:MAG: hypothetical protein SF182_30095 [Deltaproteobacteria bacterium]|nr:hypothetical protein [Deltaproteobacteria bacterium]
MMRIISFCLWGDAPRYTLGALRNAELAGRIYPGWRCRFHVASSVRREIVAGLRDRGAEVVLRPEPGDNRAMLWRALPLLDPTVDAMIARDADSRLGLRERQAVDEWLASGRSFHIMRDHPLHATAILGGMWGARAGAIPGLAELLEQHGNEDRYGADQRFLAQHVYPLVRADAWVHDEFLLHGFDAHPFPRPRRGHEFVGEVIDENEQGSADSRRALADALAPLPRCRRALRRQLHRLALALRR